MHCAMFEKYGRVSHCVKPAVLHFFYRDLTGDASLSRTTPESIDDDVCV